MIPKLVLNKYPYELLTGKNMDIMYGFWIEMSVSLFINNQSQSPGQWDIVMQRAFEWNKCS